MMQTQCRLKGGNFAMSTLSTMLLNRREMMQTLCQIRVRQRCNVNYVIKIEAIRIRNDVNIILVNIALSAISCSLHLDQHFDIEDVNRIEKCKMLTLRTHDIGQHCDVSDVIENSCIGHIVCCRYQLFSNVSKQLNNSNFFLF